eukprot:SAG31_NODE_683_length_12836_cov_8.304938_3_plen_92_part_00
MMAKNDPMQKCSDTHAGRVDSLHHLCCAPSAATAAAWSFAPFALSFRRRGVPESDAVAATWEIAIRGRLDFLFGCCTSGRVRIDVNMLETR